MEYSSFKKEQRLEAETGTSPNKFLSLLFGDLKEEENREPLLRIINIG